MAGGGGVQKSKYFIRMCENRIMKPAKNCFKREEEGKKK
jgi:hypothetical protein